jgi:hypothetical protein
MVILLPRYPYGGMSLVASEPLQQAKEPLSIEVAAEKDGQRFQRPVGNDELVHLVITIRDEGSLVGQSDVDAVNLTLLIG